MNNLIFYSHTDCLLKDNGLNHPERKERLDTVIKSIDQIDDQIIIKKEAPLADLQIINHVHSILICFTTFVTGNYGKELIVMP